VIDRQSNRSHVAWDIETTGFNWDDEITVSGFWFPAGHATLLLNAKANTAEADDYEERLEAIRDGLSVRVHVCEGEHDLLRTMHDVVFDQFDPNYNRLIAFNADSWQGGFDLPFLRTRCLAHDYPWIFEDMQFADLWEPIKKRINTTNTEFDATTDINSLTGSHAILFNNHTAAALGDSPDYPAYREHPHDPFTHAISAVYNYQHARYLPVLKHNLADVHRTWELGELIRQYVSPKDITTKKL
jgi:hypothetical protein